MAGTVTVKVTTAGGTATSRADYKFVAPVPTITSFTPATGTTSGTTTVTITGTGLYGATAVKFGTTTAKSFTVTSPTTIKAVTKPHVAGTVTVKVTTAGGTATAGSDYKFVAPVPTITSFTPATGTTSGTTTVTITGTGLCRRPPPSSSAQQQPRATPSQAPRPSRPSPSPTWPAQ